MIASSSGSPAAFHQIDPEMLRVACLQRHAAPIDRPRMPPREGER
jgi:hypothetical protein